MGGRPGSSRGPGWRTWVLLALLALVRSARYAVGCPTGQARLVFQLITVQTDAFNGDGLGSNVTVRVELAVGQALCIATKETESFDVADGGVTATRAEFQGQTEPCDLGCHDYAAGEFGSQDRVQIGLSITVLNVIHGADSVEFNGSIHVPYVPVTQAIRRVDLPDNDGEVIWFGAAWRVPCLSGPSWQDDGANGCESDEIDVAWCGRHGDETFPQPHLDGRMVSGNQACAQCGACAAPSTTSPPTAATTPTSPPTAGTQAPTPPVGPVPEGDCPDDFPYLTTPSSVELGKICWDDPEGCQDDAGCDCVDWCLLPQFAAEDPGNHLGNCPGNICDTRAPTAVTDAPSTPPTAAPATPAPSTTPPSTSTPTTSAPTPFLPPLPSTTPAPMAAPPTDAGITFAPTRAPSPTATAPMTPATIPPATIPPSDAASAPSTPPPLLSIPPSATPPSATPSSTPSSTPLSPPPSPPPSSLPPSPPSSAPTSVATPDLSNGTDRGKVSMPVLIWIGVGIVFATVAVAVVLWTKRRSTHRHDRVPVALVYAGSGGMADARRISPQSDHRFRALSAPSTSNLDQSRGWGRGRVATVNETVFIDLDRHPPGPDYTAPRSEASFSGGSTEQASHSNSLKAFQDAIRRSSSSSIKVADEASVGRRQSDVYERPLPHNVATFSPFGPAGGLGLTPLTPAGNDDDGGMHDLSMNDSSVADGGSPGNPDGDLMVTLAGHNRERIDFYV